jgi:hypothetical protein
MNFYLGRKKILNLEGCKMVFGVGKAQVKGFRKSGVGQAVPMYKSIKGLQGMVGGMAKSSQKAWKNVK